MDPKKIGLLLISAGALGGCASMLSSALNTSVGMLTDRLFTDQYTPRSQKSAKLRGTH